MITHICLPCYRRTTGGRPESWARLEQHGCSECDAVVECYWIQTAILQVRQSRWTDLVAVGPVDDTVDDIIGMPLLAATACST